ncbi:hypothetical protein SynM161_00867 [Synechococcus sp. M16.1]|nr:hypothetical protein SynM161_00867 [Synechococcus sp. M16.1]
MAVITSASRQLHLRSALVALIDARASAMEQKRQGVSKD